ncbi:hypothetical protein Srubr_00990 [Streptomyces rubradiris]|uniref:Uncharacterized protein n=1 Tax=Streptomyces rubradiris TaxID=285531 RepID=A0ABQ3R329_STRRR|nr:hypothetical protein GCM10018792_16440 [Streptomyces rubradiris]GHI50253.1 hypothetical protein Srubr_00990 [Streptomyces rubradiris]
MEEPADQPVRVEVLALLAGQHHAGGVGQELADLQAQPGLKEQAKAVRVVSGKMAKQQAPVRAQAVDAQGQELILKRSVTPIGSRRRRAQPSSSMCIVPSGASDRGRSENSATAPTR